MSQCVAVSRQACVAERRMAEVEGLQADASVRSAEGAKRRTARRRAFVVARSAYTSVHIYANISIVRCASAVIAV